MWELCQHTSLDSVACWSQCIWWECTYDTVFNLYYYCEGSSLPAGVPVCPVRLSMGSYPIRKTAQRPVTLNLSGCQGEQLKLWEWKTQVTSEHGSPEIFTSGTIFAGRLRPKTNFRLAAAEQEVRRPSTSFTWRYGKHFWQRNWVLTFNRCLKGSIGFCKPYCMCLSLLSK